MGMSCVGHLEVISQNVLKGSKVPKRGVKPIVFGNRLNIREKTASGK